MNEIANTNATETIKIDRVEHWPKDVWLARHYDPEWLSASRVAAALGHSDFSSPLKEYSELRGEIQPPDTSLAMELGHMLEPTVATLYERETGRPTWDPGEYSVVKHPDLPWLFATLDRETRNEEGQVGPLELKTTGSYNLADWKEGSPIAPQIQHQVQMECTRLPWGSLAVLVGNTSFFHWDYLHDPDFAEQLLKSVDKFHADVLAGNAPEPTWQDGDVIKALHPLDNGETVRTSDPDVNLMCADYEAAKVVLKAAEEKRDELKFKIAAKIGEASWLDTGTHRYSYKHQNRKAYAVKAAEFRTLRKEKIK